MALPGAYAPASIALRVIVVRRPTLHDKAVVLEEKEIMTMKNNLKFLTDLSNANYRK
jgi:hypothetical protein